MFKLLCCIKPKKNVIEIEDVFKNLDSIMKENCDIKDYGHIYIIQEREFVNTQQPIYKIGKSIKIVNRMPSYPKNSLIYNIIYVPFNVNKIEKVLINECDKHFIQRSDIGREYYECDLESMMNLLSKLCTKLYNV